MVNEAIKDIFNSKGYTLESLNRAAGRAVIDENYRILSDAIDNGISQRKDVSAELNAKMKGNAYLFAGWKTQKTLEEAGLKMHDEKGNIKSFEKFKNEAGEVFKKQGLNLRAEWHHAKRTAEMAALWQEILEDGDRYDIQYRTVGDSKVRKEHQRLNGTTLPPSDPFWQMFYPPNGWGCRCTVKQVRKGKYESTNTSEDAIEIGMEDTAKPSQQIFRTNAGETHKVFPRKHPNFPKNCGGCEFNIRLAYGLGKPECANCKVITEIAGSAKTVRNIAKSSLKGRVIKHPDVEQDIQISMGGIKEFTNQPHDHYIAKNQWLLNVITELAKAIYKGVTEYKGRRSHIFEVKIEGKKNWVICNEDHSGIRLYSISESDSVLKGIKK